MKKIKVLHLISTDIFSGAENVACQIIKQFETDDKYDMVYCSKIGSNKDRLDSLKIKTLPIKNFDYWSVKKAIDQYKPDIIHGHDIKASIIASMFSNKAKIVSHIHANHENMRKFNIKTFLYSLTIKKYSKIIWVSQSALDSFYYVNMVRDESIVLYNVVDSKALLENLKKDTTDYEFDLIYLGRLNYQKNPERLIKIIKDIKVKGYNVKVAIVGTGELHESIKKLIDNFELNENVKLFGYVTNPYKILNDSKILIMTSRYEGTPMVALEAMALGKPIISTPTDGLRDIIDNDKTGFLSNDDDELSEKIIEVLSDKDKYNEWCKCVKKKNDDINNIENYCAEMRKIYE